MSSTKPKPTVETEEIKLKNKTKKQKSGTTKPWLCHIRTTQPDAQQDKESRIVPGPLVLCLFPVVEVSINSLWRRKQIKHLPQGKFKVHLTEIKQSS